MTDAFTVTATLPVGQVSQQLQLPIVAASAQFTNTSSTGATVVVNASGPALLDGSGTILAPDASTTLHAPNGAELVVSAVATAADAFVTVTMERQTLTFGGLVIEAPGPGQD
jgi:hypothetical protein